MLLILQIEIVKLLYFKFYFGLVNSLRKNIFITWVYTHAHSVYTSRIPLILDILYDVTREATILDDNS